MRVTNPVLQNVDSVARARHRESVQVYSPPITWNAAWFRLIGHGL